KLTPMWSTPRHVVGRNVNSYKLETLDGARLEGEYSARRLREFALCEGMELTEPQKVYMEKVKKEEAKWIQEVAEEVARLQRIGRDEATELGIGGTTARMEDIVRPGFFYEDEEVEEPEARGDRR
ncbi:hypothetical protein L208DRAFT_1304444, partial [Tricholoma matsutake]